MSDADLYRQYPKETMHGSSQVNDENEKQALVDLAFTWAQAALMSERVLGSSFVSSPYEVGEGGRTRNARQMDSRQPPHPRCRYDMDVTHIADRALDSEFAASAHRAERYACGLQRVL